MYVLISCTLYNKAHEIDTQVDIDSFSIYVLPSVINGDSRKWWKGRVNEIIQGDLTRQIHSEGIDKGYCLSKKAVVSIENVLAVYSN